MVYDWSMFLQQRAPIVIVDIATLPSNDLLQMSRIQMQTQEQKHTQSLTCVVLRFECDKSHRLLVPESWVVLLPGLENP
jgi:hypothetical protein